MRYVRRNHEYIQVSNNIISNIFMTKYMFKYSFLVICLLIVFSCANSKSYNQDITQPYRLIKIEKLINYKLLSFATKNDTVLVVAKNGITENCVKENLVNISLQGNNKIYKLNDNGEEIIFTYYTPGGENNSLKIMTSTEKPGSTKRQIFSYNSIPYFVEKCVEVN